MAAIRKKGGKETPAISTASLPDIIFILLFFFMVATVMRETELKVNIKPAKATELQKLEKKSLVSYIYIGQPTRVYQEKYGTAPVVQLNDVLYQIVDSDGKTNSNVAEVRRFIMNERSKLPEKQQKALTTSLRVDRGVKMGIVTDVKQELRKVSAFKVNYSAVPRTDW